MASANFQYADDGELSLMKLSSMVEAYSDTLSMQMSIIVPLYSQYSVCSQPFIRILGTWTRLRKRVTVGALLLENQGRIRVTGS